MGIVIDGANRNDHKLMRQTLEAIPVQRPVPNADTVQHLCLDKGYDDREPRALADEFAFTLHLRTRGEEAQAKRHAQAKARRWVVERTHAWLNRFRAILIRWSKKPANYLRPAPFCLRYHKLAPGPTGIASKLIPLRAGLSHAHRSRAVWQP